MSFMTTKEVCEMLKIDYTTLWRWRNRGLPCVKIGKSVRFKPNDVMEWVDQQSKEA